MLAPAGAAAEHEVMLLRAFDNAVMPLRCVFCGMRTREPEKHICAGCDAELPRIESPPPPVSSPFHTVVAPVAYDFPVDAAIKALKFKRKLYYAPAFAELLCEACRELPGDIDAVLPVPLHWRRRWFRGFNQAYEIGKPVARYLGLPMVRGVIRRRATPSQSGLNARERARNLRRAFVVRRAIPHRHVLIIDDILTTGATVRQLASVVRAGGSDKVSVLTVARA
jgi:ComF family protein